MNCCDTGTAIRPRAFARYRSSRSRRAERDLGHFRTIARSWPRVRREGAPLSGRGDRHDRARAMAARSVGDADHEPHALFWVRLVDAPWLILSPSKTGPVGGKCSRLPREGERSVSTTRTVQMYRSPPGSPLLLRRTLVGQPFSGGQATYGGFGRTAVRRGVQEARILDRYATGSSGRARPTSGRSTGLRRVGLTLTGMIQTMRGRNDPLR